MTDKQAEAIRKAVYAAFAQLSSAEISALVMEPYREFKRDQELDSIAA